MKLLKFPVKFIEEFLVKLLQEITREISGETVQLGIKNTFCFKIDLRDSSEFS